MNDTQSKKDQRYEKTYQEIQQRVDDCNRALIELFDEWLRNENNLTLPHEERMKNRRKIKAKMEEAERLLVKRVKTYRKAQPPKSAYVDGRPREKKERQFTYESQLRPLRGGRFSPK